MNQWVPLEANLRDAKAMTPLMRTSMKPQWREVREHLQAVGLSATEAVLTEWVTEGDVNMGATIATRDGRVFDVMVAMGYDRDRGRVAKDEGFVRSFREVSPEKITTIADGTPNSWLQAVKIARMILDMES